MTTSEHRHRPGPGIVAAISALFVAGLVAAQQPAPPQTPQQPSEIATRISGDSGAPPHYAVPDFIALTPNATAIAQMLAQVLWDDLNFEREFDMIPRDVYKSVPMARSMEQIPFGAWREVGADGVFFGTVAQKGNDIVVQVRLFNVRSRESVYAQEMTIATRSARRIAHEVADAVHMQQRGVRGVARTRLTFVSDRLRESVLGTVEKRSVKEVWVADYDGANELRITNSRDLNINPSWSNDARAIAYSAYRANNPPEILLSFITTGVLQNLTKGRLRDGSYLPAFSPDGKRIAFAATAEGASSQDIYVINVDGTNLRRVTTHPDIDTTPTWSPSGTQIAFTSNRTGRPQIYIMNADGGGVQRLDIPDGEADRATWAPLPHNEIAYTARNGPGYDIKVYDLASRTTRQLTFSEGSNEAPAYSPSGRHLAFSSTRSGPMQIFTIGRDGNGLRQVTRSGNNQTPDWSN
jgi:TolB protein